MTAPPVVHGFETSNNIKVRVALGYKEIGYEFRTVEPRDRDELVRLSGQYLTPVMVHGERVIFDSAAILRYLDVAFPDTPKLFGHSHAEQWEIEDWELFARATLARPMMDVVHTRVYGGEVEGDELERHATAYAEAFAKLASSLGGRTWLVGDAMTAADISAAAVVRRIREAELFTSSPQKDVDHWVDAVMRFDGPCRLA
jgi:glutathione S-transferase